MQDKLFIESKIMDKKYLHSKLLYEDSVNNMNRVVSLEDGSLYTLGVIKRELQNMGPYRKSQFIFSRKSFDGGRTWTLPKTLFEIPERQIYTNLAQFMISRDGFLHVFLIRIWKYSFEKKEFEGDILHARMDDVEGTNLRLQKVKCLDRYTGALNNLIQLYSGRLVVPFSTLDENTGIFQSSTIYSDNEGITWNASNKVTVVSNETHVESGAVEPVITEITKGLLVMIIRTVLGCFYYSVSRDGGKNWSKSKKSNIKSSNSPAVIQKLNDGRLLMVWNNCNGMPMRGLRYSMARQCLHAAVSDDGLKTLKGIRMIVKKTKGDNDDVLNCYPFSSPVGVNNAYLRIMTVQSKDGENWREPGAKLICLDSSFLSETSLVIDNCEIEIKATKEKPGYVFINFPYGQRGTLEITYENQEKINGLQLILSDNYIDVSNFNLSEDNECYRQFIEENYQIVPVSVDRGQGVIKINWGSALSIENGSKTIQVENRFAGFNHIGILLKKGEIAINSINEKSDKAWLDTGIDY
jgi:hypothetical protein